MIILIGSHLFCARISPLGHTLFASPASQRQQHHRTAIALGGCLVVLGPSALHSHSLQQSSTHQSRVSGHGWQADVHIAHAEQSATAEANGVVHLGAITRSDGSAVPYVMLKRTALEDRAVAGLLAHFHSHLHSLRARGGAGSADSRMLLHFDETPEAEEAQVQAYEQFRG